MPGHTRTQRAFIGLTIAAAATLAHFARAQPALDRLEEEANNPAPRGAAAAPRGAGRGYAGLVVDRGPEADDTIAVLKVVPKGPAERSGIQPGDRILAVDGRPVATLDEMAELLASRAPGDTLRVTIDRAGEERQLELTLATAPAKVIVDDQAALPAPQTKQPAPEVEPRKRLLGIRAAAVTEEIRLLYDLPSTRGALVAEVVVGSPAHQQGIPLDAVIVEAAGQPIDSPADLAAAVSAASPRGEIALGYYVRGQLVRKTIRLVSPDVFNDAETVPARPAPNGAVSAKPPVPTGDDAAARIAELEARIVELEQKLQQLDERLRELLSRE